MPTGTGRGVNQPPSGLKNKMHYTILVFTFQGKKLRFWLKFNPPRCSATPKPFAEKLLAKSHLRGNRPAGQALAKLPENTLAP